MYLRGHGIYPQLLIKFFYVAINLISLNNNQVFLEDTELSRKVENIGKYIEIILIRVKGIE
jgi:hypothetical protein